ncbi:hypothetical protein JOC83_002233 [Bacillus iocasae]|uniref:Uncharacterized protein n=1 Tax=Priestia iocasae TaxID=2291674 RepID=A0ABS2QV65_9BACI|nr:hypothetical protein [Metabacillus iocasae]
MEVFLCTVTVMAVVVTAVTAVADQTKDSY